jgi:short-subunit dehydrogenase
VQLGGATTLLTGATGGLGQAIARALAARGALLVLTGRRVDVLEPLASELGGRALAADLSSADGVDRLLAETGPIDVLVANAGLPAAGRLRTFSVEEIDRALAVNLRAPMVLARALADGMAERRRGHMVFVSSLSGKAAGGGGSVYSATKFGLRGFALSLREDLARHGVGVSVVLPGFIRDAGMFHESGTKLPFFAGTKTPEEVARAVVEAIERDRAEIDVAPFGLRVGAALAGLAPGPVLALQRRLGADKVSSQLETGQANKR